ncbi:hypothetical protein [Hydrogenimonas sp.]
MKRRAFLKTAIGTAASMALAPSLLAEERVKRLPLEEVKFSSVNEDAQTLIIYLMGGMGDIVGNMSNWDELLKLDGNGYENYRADFTPTTDGFWQEAGGDFIQKLLDDGNGTIFRTCINKDTLKAHLLNQKRNMRGNNVGYESGMITTLFHVFNRNGVIPQDKVLSNVSFVDSNFPLLTDNATEHALPSHLKPVSFGWTLENRFVRKESSLHQYIDDNLLDSLSEEMNAREGINGKISDYFIKRPMLETFMDKLMSEPLPEGIDYRVDVKGSHMYDPYGFGLHLENAMRIFATNPDTKVISMTTESWDDHSDAIPTHKSRGHYLFWAIYNAMNHAKALGKENISIVLFGDFGRNMLVNPAKGWDHGNNQCVFWFGGKKFVNHLGVVGETELDVQYGRIFTKPIESSYSFEPYAIAATFYKLYGIQNPEILTGGYKAIGDDNLEKNFIKT